MDQPVNRRRAVTALVAAALGAGLVWVLPGALPGASAQDETSSTTSTSIVSGNPDCGDLVDAAFEFRIEVGNDLPDETTYTDPATGFEVTIFDVHVSGGTAFFSFESNIPVSAVFVKAGQGGILYTFDPPSTIGIDLASPKASISHISFCRNTPPPPTTTADHAAYHHPDHTADHYADQHDHHDRDTVDHHADVDQHDHVVPQHDELVRP
jgi:hypothetical protein